MQAATLHTINLGERQVEYRLIRSKTARKRRVRVGLAGVEVVQPEARDADEIEAFLVANEKWIIGQLERIERFRSVRKPQRNDTGEILYRGTPTPVCVEDVARRQRTNKIVFEQGCLVVMRGHKSRTPPVQSLENWLRKQARTEIARHLDAVTRRLKQYPRKVYVMDQRTKWGNCSGLQNLSFNWRLIMAPDFVMQYLVTHEAVHLAVPDHSRQFWLTVQSLCPDMERARQWLSANSQRLFLDLHLLHEHKRTLSETP
jgi:predicted metal-dependent hydrolase